MSLRKSPRLTPQLLVAARNNAQHSTGPRSPAAKNNSKLNALKHGERADPENHRQVMLALGEDPEEFDNLKQELIASFGPGDALWEKQIDDLARLYWRRDRLERAQEGVMRRALLAVEEWQHRRRLEMEGATFDASQSQAVDIDMTEPTDPGVRLRMLLSFLGVIREQVKQRIFKHRQVFEIETLYRGKKGWRQARLCYLLWLFRESLKHSAHDKELQELLTKNFGPREPAGEPQYQELLRLLDEEIASVQEEFQYAEKVNEEKAAIERDACLAPVGDQWRMMLRREETLDRAIDRKVRILLALRKEFPDPNPLASPPDQGDDAEMEDIKKILGIDIPSEDPGVSHSPKACPPAEAGNGNPMEGRHSRAGGNPSSCGLSPAYARVTATDENKKMNERSRNVTENKGLLRETPAIG